RDAAPARAPAARALRVWSSRTSSQAQKTPTTTLYQTAGFAVLVFLGLFDHLDRMGLGDSAYVDGHTSGLAEALDP
ncbi:hypothetical protein, partial [Microvirga tunisiensis]|uniref:hypothetical protein n=1 Tax=Microvirga tunisiensis TaxID=2108360 RepID=UPI001AEE6CCA